MITYTQLLDLFAEKLSFISKHSDHKLLQLEKIELVRDQLNLSEVAFHRIGLMIYGISIDTELSLVQPFLKGRVERFYGFIASSLDTFGYRLSIPIVDKVNTPYSTQSVVGTIDGRNHLRLNFNGEPIPNVFMRRYIKPICLSTTNRSYYFQDYKTVSHPNLPYSIDKSVLVLDPFHACPVKCSFCLRSYDILKSKDNTFVVNATDLISQIKEQHGDDVFEHVLQVSIVTGTPSEKEYLKRLKDIVRVLKQEGFFGRLYQANAAIVSEDGLKTLQSLGFDQFSWPIEMFTDRLRQQHMRYPKNIPFSQVVDIFDQARKLGFQNLQSYILAGYDDIPTLFNGLKTLAEMEVDAIVSTFVAYTPQHANIYNSQPHTYNRLLYFLKAYVTVQELGFRRVPVTESNRALLIDTTDENHNARSYVMHGKANAS